MFKDPRVILYCVMAFFLVLILLQIRKESKRLGVKPWQI